MYVPEAPAPIIDASKQVVAIGYSSENLLLNGYRQCQFGLPCMCFVDTTARLILEGHVVMVFGTVDPSCHFHVIGHGVCSNEDTDAHAHIATILFREMERVVEDRRQKQEGI